MSESKIKEKVKQAYIKNLRNIYEAADPYANEFQMFYGAAVALQNVLRLYGELDFIKRNPLPRIPEDWEL